MPIPIITIQGPTASGKSALACELALKHGGEIISADSRQVYKFLDIGTAKPDVVIQSQIKHHLIDIITPDQRYSAGDFVKDASVIIENIHNAGKVPIVCGGSMLYIQSLLQGLSEVPDIPPEAAITAKAYISEHSPAECYEFVRQHDPKFASRIGPTDKQRISRAIEVWFAFQTPLTAFWEQQKTTCRYEAQNIFVHCERDVLYKRINQRMRDMIKAGLIDEIEGILKMGYTASDYGLNTVGYKEFLCLFDGSGARLEDCTELAAQHTRNYAKRQMTWYRGMHNA